MIGGRLVCLGSFECLVCLLLLGFCLVDLFLSGLCLFHFGSMCLLCRSQLRLRFIGFCLSGRYAVFGCCDCLLLGFELAFGTGEGVLLGCNVAICLRKACFGSRLLLLRLVECALGGIDLCLGGIILRPSGACLCGCQIGLRAVVRRLRCGYLAIRGGLCLLGRSQRARCLVVSALRGALSLLGIGERGIGSGLCSLCLVKNLLGICGRLLGGLDFLRRCVGGCLLGRFELGLCICCRLLCGVECLCLALGIGLGRVKLALGILQRGTGAIGSLNTFIELTGVFGTRGGFCLRIVGDGSVVSGLSVVAGRLLFGIGGSRCVVVGLGFCLGSLCGVDCGLQVGNFLGVRLYCGACRLAGVDGERGHDCVLCRGVVRIVGKCRERGEQRRTSHCDGGGCGDGESRGLLTRECMTGLGAA